eukprot:3531643-Pleurochrysis_carterae.AAC.1
MQAPRSGQQLRRHASERLPGLLYASAQAQCSSAAALCLAGSIERAAVASLLGLDGAMHGSQGARCSAQRLARSVSWWLL